MALASDFDHRVLAPPQERPRRYSKELLEMVRQLERDSSIVVLNPRDLSAHSLFYADADFLSDKSLYYAHVRYWYDRKRPKPPQK